MNFMERFTALKKQQQEIQDGLQSLTELQDTIDRDGWVFCLHTHYDEPRVSVWRSGDTWDNAQFIIKGDYVELYDAGMYQEESHEIKSILDEWLLKGLTIKE